MKVKVNVLSVKTGEEIFMAWANDPEVEELAGNLLYFATDAEKEELMAVCNGKMSEMGWAEYVNEYMPALRNRIARAMASLY